jgi:hypothetical protein
MATIPSGTKFIGINASIPTPELSGKIINNKTEHYTVEDLVATVGVGSQGPQGIQGPAGPPGPVGPAGLEWKGSWASGNSYVENDAVGYEGASYFCILATDGTTAPNQDTTHWALLASQGAIGPQGAQGPTGPQGPQGPQGPVATQTLQQTVNLGNTITNGTLTTTLADNFISIGANANNGLTLSNNQIVYRKTSEDFIIKFPTSLTELQLVEFRNASGTIAFVEDFALTNNTTTALSLSTLNSQYQSIFYYNGFRVFCPNIIGGGLVYSKTGDSTWVSQPITTVS